MEEKIYKIIQKYLINLGEGMDLRNRLHKIYKKSCCGVMDWLLLSRESKLKVIEEIRNTSAKEDAQIFQSCFLNKTPEFYVNRIDFVIACSEKKKIKLKAIEEGLTIMILCIALTEEIKFLNYEDRKPMLSLLKERLQKEEKSGIPFGKCFEEIFDIVNND